MRGGLPCYDEGPGYDRNRGMRGGLDADQLFLVAVNHSANLGAPHPALGCLTKQWTLSHLSQVCAASVEVPTVQTQMSGAAASDVPLRCIMLLMNSFAQWLNDLVRWYSTQYCGVVFTLAKYASEVHSLGGAVHTAQYGIYNYQSEDKRLTHPKCMHCATVINTSRLLVLFKLAI